MCVCVLQKYDNIKNRVARSDITPNKYESELGFIGFRSISGWPKIQVFWVGFWLPESYILLLINYLYIYNIHIIY